MKNENFITIQGWMINELNLKGNELLLYAIIYGFSQDGECEYHGSISYIMKSLKASRPNVVFIIKNLIDKKLIKRTKESHYIASKESLLPWLTKLTSASKESLPLGSKESLPNNYNTNYNTNYTKKIKKSYKDGDRINLKDGTVAVMYFGTWVDSVSRIKLDLRHYKELR